MVTFLATSDFHGNHAIAEYMSQKAMRYNIDLVVIAGDIHGPIEGSARIFDPFIEKNQRVLFIPGNWDSSKEIQELASKGRLIHNYYVTYDNVSFIGFGVSDMKMRLNTNDEKQLQSLFQSVKAKKKVFVSHLHVAGTKAEFSGVPGDVILRKTIEQFKPDIVLAGHIHEGEGIEDKIGETRIFQIGRQGKIIEL